MIGAKIQFPKDGASALRAEMEAQRPFALSFADKDLMRALGLHLRSGIVSADSERRTGAALALAAMTCKGPVGIA
jgi:hypothetical protein